MKRDSLLPIDHIIIRVIQHGERRVVFQLGLCKPTGARYASSLEAGCCPSRTAGRKSWVQTPASTIYYLCALNKSLSLGVCFPSYKPGAASGLGRLLGRLRGSSERTEQALGGALRRELPSKQGTRCKHRRPRPACPAPSCRWACSKRAT